MEQASFDVFDLLTGCPRFEKFATTKGEGQHRRGKRLAGQEPPDPGSVGYDSDAVKLDVLRQAGCLSAPEPLVVAAVQSAGSEGLGLRELKELIRLRRPSLPRTVKLPQLKSYLSVFTPQHFILSWMGASLHEIFVRSAPS